MGSKTVLADVDTVRRGRIRITNAFYESDAVQMVPGVRWHARGEDYWSAPLELPAIYALDATFGARLELTPALLDWTVDKYNTLVKPVRDLKASPLALAPDFPTPHALVEYKKRLAESGLELRKFQEVAAVMLSLSRQALLADDLGAGKTVEVIAAMAISPDPYPALIVVPPSVLYMWPVLLGQWLPDAKVTVLTGPPAKRRTAITSFERNGGDVLVTTYDNLKSHSRAASYGNTALKRCEECGGTAVNPIKPTNCEAHEKELNRISWRTVILDEAHRIKDPTIARTRTAWGVSRGSTYRWALTGTPTEKHAGQLWPILHFLNPDEFSTNVGYRDRYLDQYTNVWGGLEVLGIRPERLDEFHKATSHRILRRPKALILPELPPKVYTERRIELSTAERKSYDEMKTKLITQLDTGTLFASSPLVLAARLFQMSSGVIDVKRGDDDGQTEVTFTGKSSTLDEVDELVSEMSPTPVVIFFVNVGLVKLCTERLLKKGYHVSTVFGEVAPADRAIAIRDFQEGRTNVFIGTYASAGEGVTLTRASTMIRAQRPWSSLQDMQGEDRLHRIGAEGHESITYVDIVVENTIAAHIPALLARKSDNLQEILRDEEVLRSCL